MSKTIWRECCGTIKGRRHDRQCPEGPGPKEIGFGRERSIVLSSADKKAAKKAPLGLQAVRDGL